MTATLDTPITEPTAETALYERRWWALSVLCLSLLIVFVGNSSLNVTIPTLSRELGATTSQLQWVVAGYSLVFAGLLFTTGALGDRFGRKGVLQIGLLLFLVGAGLAASSHAMWELIGCRALMGVAAALIMPSTLSILVNIFPPHERAKAIAIWAGITGGAGSLGPVASGWLLGHYWYGSVFLVNVPIVLVALVAGRFLVPTSKDPAQAALDPVGAGLSIVGIVSIVYGLIEAPVDGWASPGTLIAFAIGALGLAAFCWWEVRVDEPMLDVRYFRNPAFSTGTGGMILVFMAMFGVMFLITQYFQLILNFSPFGAAMRFLPMAPIMMIVAPLTPRITARFGAHRTVATGLGFVALGMALFSRLDAHTPYSYILVCVVPLVSGMALTMAPMTASIMSAVPSRRAGAGSAMNDATRELGTALGIAVLGSVAASRYAAQLAPSLHALPASLQGQARSSLAGALDAATKLHGRASTTLTAAAQHSFINGIHFAVATGAVLALVAAFVVYRFLPRTVTAQDALHSADAALATAALESA